MRRAHNDWWIQRQGVLNETFTKSNVDSVSIRTDQDYVGLMKVRDAETGHEQWIDTSSRALRRAHNDWWIQRQGVLNETFTKSNVDSVSIRTDQDYVKSLLNLFAKRN